MGCTGGMLALWPTVEGFIAGQVMGLAIPTAIFGLPFLDAARCRSRPGSARLQPAAWRQIVNYGLAFVPFALLGWLSNLADRYILVAYLDAAAVGQYVAAFAIGSRLPTLVGGLMNDLSPARSVRGGKPRRSRARQEAVRCVDRGDCSKHVWRLCCCCCSLAISLPTCFLRRDIGRRPLRSCAGLLRGTDLRAGAGGREPIAVLRRLAGLDLDEAGRRGCEHHFCFGPHSLDGRRWRGPGQCLRASGSILGDDILAMVPGTSNRRKV